MLQQSPLRTPRDLAPCRGTRGANAGAAWRGQKPRETRGPSHPLLAERLVPSERRLYSLAVERGVAGRGVEFWLVCVCACAWACACVNLKTIRLESKDHHAAGGHPWWAGNSALRACARVVHPFENQEVWREAH